MQIRARTILATVVLGVVTQGVLAAPRPAVSTDRPRSFEVAAKARTSPIAVHEELDVESVSPSPALRRVHRPRRSSADPHDEEAAVDVLRRLLFSRTPRHHRDDHLDFGGLRVDDFRREARNGGGGGAASVAEPFEYEDDDDGGDAHVVGAIVTAPRARCPLGKRYYQGQCREVWR